MKNEFIKRIEYMEKDLLLALFSSSSGSSVEVALSSARFYCAALEGLARSYHVAKVSKVLTKALPHCV